MKTKNSLINEKNKKILKKILFKILYIIIIILIIYNLLYIINNTFNNKKYVSIFGKIYITTEKDKSMKPNINVNDFIIVKKVDKQTIKRGDIIGYDINDEITFRKVIGIEENEGITYYQTKGNIYHNNDLEKKTYEQVNGKIAVRIPIIGLIFRIFENKIITIFLMLVLLLKFSFNKYRYKKSKKIKEQNKEKA